MLLRGPPEGQGVQGGCEVLDQVLRVLQADGQADGAVGDAKARPFLGADPHVGGGGGGG